MRPYDVAKAMGGGLLGTLLQTIMVYGVAPLIAGPSMAGAAITGHACAPSLLVHLLSGSVIFPLGVCMAVVPSLLWTTSPAGDALGRLLWVVAEVIMAPMLSVEVFSTALGGVPAALRALLEYLVYGATLGSLAGAVQPEDRYIARL